jgi:D-sedoheptulose 7-phosphate isomerase
LSSSSHAKAYLAETREILGHVDSAAIEDVVSLLADVRGRGGRVFFVGVGGGAALASHAVCDARKLLGVEAYSPLDNVAELTAQINDHGWDDSLVRWLQESLLARADLVFVFSVGGGDVDSGISVNLVRALEHASSVGAAIAGIVGPRGGRTREVADACVVIPAPLERMTPHTEGLQAVIWHLIVSHPTLQEATPKWEGIAVPATTGGRR